MAAGLQACPGSAVVQGIDVSVYQGTIAWPQVKSAGRDFAFARVSDGVGFVDSEFAHNWQGMKAAGVVRGAYQYFRAGQDPVGEADLVAASLRDAGGLSGADLPIVMDIETADGQSAAVVRANMATWLGAIARATGKTPIIYTNSDTSALIGVEFGAYALWVANWAVRCPVMPAGWPRWAFWQYSDRGSVPGIAGAVDLDELDGTLSRLAAFGAPPTDEGGVAEEGAVTVRLEARASGRRVPIQRRRLNGGHPGVLPSTPARPWEAERAWPGWRRLLAGPSRGPKRVRAALQVRSITRCSRPRPLATPLMRT